MQNHQEQDGFTLGRFFSSQFTVMLWTFIYVDGHIIKIQNDFFFRLRLSKNSTV